MKLVPRAFVSSALLLAVPSACFPAHPKQCSDVDPGYNVSLVVARARELASHSWEYGTLSEALLELYNPEYSVFSLNAFPNGQVPSPPVSIESLAYASQHIRLDNTTLVDGDGASGDPASLGVSAILIGQTEPDYFAAATRQEQHLFAVPRMSNGAISQRDANAQAWADFVYMAPPFLAYYAVRTNNVSLLQETVRQCDLYRELLQNTAGPNRYWRHIEDQSNSSMQDNGIWSTGNAWASAGMTRVLATLTHWSGSKHLTAERDQLVLWIQQIIDGARNVPRDPSSNLLRNYLNNETWFGEVSGTALMASVVYRMAILAPETFTADPYVAWADESRTAIAAHVTSNGTLSPAINPLNWFDLTPFTSGSPEGQSFGTLLYTAYRDYVCSRHGGWGV